MVNVIDKQQYVRLVNNYDLTQSGKIICPNTE